MSQGDPPIQIVDENDQPIGQATKEEAQRKGLFHRVARVIVVNEDGDLLFQKRADSLNDFPGLWDNSAAGHVDSGETYETAAVREAKEEIGLDITTGELKEAAHYLSKVKLNGREFNRYNKVFIVRVPSDTDFLPDSSEVSKLEWFSVAKILKLANENPESLTFGTVESIERCYDT